MEQNPNKMNKIKETHPLLHFIIADYHSSLTNSQNKNRSLHAFARGLTTIYDYDVNIYKHFEKRIITEKDFKNFWNGTFAEIIVMAFYIREEFKVEFETEEADLILKIDDDPIYLEVFSINPDLKVAQNIEDIKCHDIKTHLPIINTSSVRGKLHGKLGENQDQFKDGRKNIAVIELNNTAIAGNFHILSSLSGGYEILLDKNTGKVVNGGFNWNNNNFFTTEGGKRISAIIWFDMGDYEDRRKIKNPNASCLIDDMILEGL
ncbi:MAG: hypothetical protein NOU37_07720 [Candidatus Brocadiales bacterium]|nr:hypothetical protein [Candidatus Bathyanammoxibius amoris]